MEKETNQRRPELMQGLLTVVEKRYLTPHYIRVSLTCENILDFSKARVGDNCKIIIPEVENKDLLAVIKDGQRPSGTLRTYTLRALDLEKGLMTIDFVAHGENGPASKWAIHAKATDQLAVLMKVKEKPLYISSDWYWLTGDHTALPVISVILESLPKDARGKAIIEVYGPEDVLNLTKPDNVEIIWTFNNKPGESSTLSPYFTSDKFVQTKSCFIFVAAEYTVTQKIQLILRENFDLPDYQWRIYSYWKYGESEDIYSEKRRERSH